MLLLDFSLLFLLLTDKKAAQASGQQGVYSYSLWLLQVCFPSLFSPVLLFKPWQAFKEKHCSYNSFCPIFSLEKPFARRWPHSEMRDSPFHFSRQVKGLVVMILSEPGLSPFDARHWAPICSTITSSDGPCAAILLTFISSVWDCMGKIFRGMSFALSRMYSFVYTYLMMQQLYDI